MRTILLLQATESENTTREYLFVIFPWELYFRINH
jgi:hypothetical protein